MASMVEIVDGRSGAARAAAARLLHDFNAEYGAPAPDPPALAARLAELVSAGHVTVLVVREDGTGRGVGVAVLRIQPSVWSPAQEAYLAELYVVPDLRGRGYGRELITAAVDTARERGADYAFVITSEEDRLAQRLYEAAGFRRTEGEGGPVMLAYERDL
jgi:ribosomal protein S18 acetylase RimI-like enzyme